MKGEVYSKTHYIIECYYSESGEEYWIRIDADMDYDEALVKYNKFITSDKVRPYRLTECCVTETIMEQNK